MSNENSEAVSKESAFQYTPLGPIWKYTQILLWASACLTVVSAFFSTLLIEFFQRALAMRGGVDQETIRQVLTIDTVQFLLAIAAFALFIATSFMFLKQTYYAMCNVHLFDKNPRTVSPRWAVGFYFVPILNLWKPVEAIRQIWRVSEDPDFPEMRPVPIQIGLWWFFWIAAAIASQSAFRGSLSSNLVSMDPEGHINKLIRIERLNIASDVAMVAATLLAIWMWSHIVANQNRTMA